MIKQTIPYFFAFAAGAGLYGLGYWHGQHSKPALADQRSLVTDSVQLAQTDIAPPGEQSGAQPGLGALEPETFDRLLDNSAWFALERWLVENREELNYTHGARLVQVFAQRLNKYDAVAMRRVLRAYLNVMAADIGVLLLLSDLQQLSGMREAALETLFTVLALAPEPPMMAQARRQADQIIFVIDNELKIRGALAEREAFWQHNSQRLPSSDRYRYEWAKSLASLQQWQQALRVLAETGTSDIAQETLDELRALIENSEQGLQFQRDGDRMLSAAKTPAGVTLTLLVDTGANVTSLSRTALRSVAAVRLTEQARIRTANGVVQTGVYRVPEIEIQGRRFSNLRVIELPVELPGLDGLLGLDILNALSLDPLNLN
jgi:predicted aspartyl protease